jgi:hypothetical protein
MDLLAPVLQLVLGLGILNVWLLRRNQPTAYRGGGAPSLFEEFRAYGLPDSVFYLVGALKLIAAALLLFGLSLPVLVRPGALLLAGLMAAALAMHLKIRDPLSKSLPAASLLVLCIVLLALR